jgi:hypothetical protein
VGILEEVKEVADLIKKVGDADLYRKIVNLEGEVFKLARDNRHLQQQIESLQEALALSKKFSFKDPYYWVEGDSAPYCPACWDTKKLATNIVTIAHPMLHTQKQCPSCGHIYEGGRF